MQWQDVGSTLEGWQLGSCGHQLSVCSGCWKEVVPLGRTFHSKGKVARGIMRERGGS